MKDEFIKVEIRRRGVGSINVTVKHLGEDGYIYVDSESCGSKEEATSFVNTAINGARKSQALRSTMRAAGRDPLAELQVGKYMDREE
jgi:hypothetical protein